MSDFIFSGLLTLNQLLTAGIAITAFSLLLYALSFNLRDRVARSFALILVCVVVVFVADAIASITNTPTELEFWLKLEWVGITFLPTTYVHFSDALLATTGRPSRGRRRLVVRLMYLVSAAFLATLPFSLLVGPLGASLEPAPHLERTWLTWVFTGYYVIGVLFAGINFWRAYRGTVSRSSRRRMGYLMVGALAPALGSYPFLLFGSNLAARLPMLFWFAATLSNFLISALLVLMAYSVAFFGVPWPDRVVKRRLFKWLMRGPVTASTILAITTLVRRAGQSLGLTYSAAVPIIMVASILILEHWITLAAPIWERWLFHGNDRDDITLLQKLEERLLTSGDLRQFLESVLAAVCDRLQAPGAFVAGLGSQGLELFVTIGDKRLFEKENLSADIIEISKNGFSRDLFTWGDYWLIPLHEQREESGELVGLLGIVRLPEKSLEEEQLEALSLLASRAAQALEDRRLQRQVFSSLEALTPEVELIQNLRAAARFESGVALSQALTGSPDSIEQGNLTTFVKEALTHYWGGPKLTESPLIKLRVVQQALNEHDGNPTNALRAILRQAIERLKPEGERRFTAEWILYNILELKFMEGRKVREVAMRLAMSEADLYRKQRVAIEAIANTIIEMEQQAVEGHYMPAEFGSDNVSNTQTRWV
ncbi:MAG TPA: histidine kinase N-terminal 7TM domain-containing protein [Anaerolineales bacterium]|nr:histidine kinase N-terminal 7TM domain-containing protein [Anaerolineales bacterium]